MQDISRRGALLGGVALAGCASLPSNTAHPAERLYMLGGAKVFRMDPDTGKIDTIVDQSPKDGSRGSGLNDGIAIDHARRHIYWSNMGRAPDDDGFLMRSNLDGSNVIQIVKPGGAFTPKQIKLDFVNGKVVWSDREGMSVRRANLDGSNIEVLWRSGDPVRDKGQEWRWCVGLAIDPARNEVYWTQKGADNAGQGVIRRAKMTPWSEGSSAETLFASLPEPIDLDLEFETRTLYWTDRGDNTINRARLDGGKRELLVHGAGEAIGVALDLKRNRMAYTSLGGTVGMSDLDGRNARTLAKGLGTLTGCAWGA